MSKDSRGSLRALHINSYFLSNNIHYNFYKRIKAIKDDQFLIPVYKHFKGAETHGIAIDYVFDQLDSKIFFTKAIKIIYLAFKKKLLKDYEYIHAHTLFSDGFGAYLLSILLKKKLVISVRDTDVRLFLPKSKLFVWIGRKILKRAGAVFCISPSIKNTLTTFYPNISGNKLFMLPNGLDGYWLDHPPNIARAPLKSKEVINLLFVGQIIPRKNLAILLSFITSYNDKQYVLQVVGKNTDSFNFEAFNKGLQNNNKVVYLGELSSKEELRQIYLNNDIFVLLSHAETFGVVYIEALSQGLPIIYTKNQGIDGFFPSGEVGYSCSEDDVHELKERLDLVIARSSQLSERSQAAAKLFAWEDIIKNYLEVIDRL
ncbi:glycosyltransferase family 4 protein [Olivibacter sp. SDN3]|uniref:glycosyltransferase family 4 protein n=1 Tax=Olivibacter sp. SDN3 TaxID=2764720 RepID=UPI0016511A52|nr:glycosyltransferase family 4 protein [Olivibacter sp. SDN3]QNL51603.1 glycosyltransferase family 4 protein [Olivibacter sp. SDN3]